MIRSRRRWPALLRTLALGLFALGLVLQPVVAAAAELHEFAHDRSGAHLHLSHDHAATAGADAQRPGEAADVADTGPDRTRILHVLLHFAHCCGAVAALLPAAGTIAAPPAHGRLAVAPAAATPPRAIPSPFKPPIVG